MLSLDHHPTVLRLRQRGALSPAFPSQILDAEWLKGICLESGADDVGFVDLANEALGDQREDILSAFPGAKSLIAFVRKLGRENLRSPSRSAANLEFHLTIDEVDETSRRIATRLHHQGIGAFYPAGGFPMEMDRWGTGKSWIISHKPVAVAAGLGRMGIHRNVIHPVFGNFILLGSVVVDAEVSEYGHPIDYNPCLGCKLCVAACPTGAIGDDGSFGFSACFTHNYREFMGGFSDWVETIAGSGTAKHYRAEVSDSETVSMWQSLAYGPNYKAAYCMAVCPAGEDVIGPFLKDHKNFVKEVLEPFTKKVETIFVVPGSDAESYVRRRFPNKAIKFVGNGLRPSSVRSFLQTLPLVFQKGQAKTLDATYHFVFTGAESSQGTVIIRDQKIQVHTGLKGKPDLRIDADSATWLKFLRKEKNILAAILTRKVRVHGPLRLLISFGRCFPSKVRGA